jgi:hypothetical protein
VSPEAMGLQTGFIKSEEWEHWDQPDDVQEVVPP